MDISVITPFYKGNAFMEQLFGCLRRNAAAAEGVDIELVLVNDSPDTAIVYDESWVEGFSLQIAENPVNVGIQRSRIHGLEVARGEFVMFLDQDDLLVDNALASQYRFCGEGDVIVSNGINENRDRHNPIYHSLAHQRQVAFPRFYYAVGCLIVSPGQCLIRKDVIPAAWKEKCIDCNGSDDYYLWLLLQGECRWAVNPEVLYTHVDTGENLSIDIDRMLRSSREVLALLKQDGKITPHYERLAERRFRMRKFYEGRARWRKAAACLLYPDLFVELLIYTGIKKLCR